MTTEKPLPPSATVPIPPPAPKAGKKVGGKNVVELTSAPTSNQSAADATDAKASEDAKAAKEAAALAKKEAAAKAKEEKAAAKAKKDEERAAAKAAKEAAKAPRVEQNGVKQAQEGTSSRAIWDLTQELSLAKGSLVPMSDVKAACEAQPTPENPGGGRWFTNKAGVNTKINPANVAIEYQMYRKFNGFPPVVVEKKVDPAVEAAKAAKAKEREEAKAKKAAEKEAAKAKKAAEKAEKVAKPEAPTAKVKAIPAESTPSTPSTPPVPPTAPPAPPAV